MLNLITMETQERIIEIQKELKALKKKRLKFTSIIDNEIDSLEDELLTICPHTETEEKESYVSGDYYNQSQYITTTICKICGKELNIYKRYGGYG